MADTDARTANLRMYVNDMVALEKDILNAIEKQRDDERVKADAEISSLVERLYTTTKAHLLTMENHAAAIGGEPGTAIKEAVASVAGTIAGVYDWVRKHPVSRMLRDDYTALSLASIAYSMLHTTGLAHRELPIANVALRHLREIAPLIMELGKVIPGAVVRELAEDDASVDPTVTQLARDNTLSAWAEASA
jgi:hypothetical protein